jgi:hypothetical protein
MRPYCRLEFRKIKMCGEDVSNGFLVGEQQQDAVHIRITPVSRENQVSNLLYVTE